MKKENTTGLSLLLFLFVNFFKVALFIIGGGLVMIPMIEDIFVRQSKKLKSKDILDMLALVQILPGLVAVNSAIFIGHKLAGFKGAVISVIGVILPSIIIITLIAAVFVNLDIQNPHILKAFSCVRACVVATFFGMIVRLKREVLKDCWDYMAIGLGLICLMAGVSQIALILLSIPLGWLLVLCHKGENQK